MRKFVSILLVLSLFLIPSLLTGCFQRSEDGVKGEVLRELNYRGLTFYEKFGGHTIKKHVGKSYKWLVERLKEEPRLRSASSFYDLETAEMVVRKAISENGERIKRWLSEGGAPDKLVLIYRGDRPIGIKVVRGKNYYIERVCKDARIVLKKDKRFGFIVLTAYPT